MTIRTVFTRVSCSDLEISAVWYEKLFGMPPLRRPNPATVEFQVSESAEVQVCAEREHAGHTTLTLGVLPMQPERDRLVAAGLEPEQIEETDGYFTMHLRDPDHNRVVLASVRKA